MPPLPGVFIYPREMVVLWLSSRNVGSCTPWNASGPDESCSALKCCVALRKASLAWRGWTKCGSVHGLWMNPESKGHKAKV